MAALGNIPWLQVARRIVQLVVVLMIVAIPSIGRYNNYLSAHELDRMIRKWDGSLPGHALVAIDSSFRMLPRGEVERAGRSQRNRTNARETAQLFRGGPWSLEIGALSMTDPLAAAESALATRKIPWVLAAGVAIPLLATLLLGRVFCSWICPMGLLLECSDKLRNLLRFLELRPRNLRAARGTKYVLLMVGLLLTAVFAIPVLGYAYPPALLSRELHDLVFATFDRAEMGRFGFWIGDLSWVVAFLAGIVVVEVLVSQRWWCRYVCPGGALYSLVGWARPARVKLVSSRCTGCAQCTAACPMGLNPMKNEMGMECDSCGVCISSCNDDALDYGFETPLLSTNKIALLLCTAALFTPAPSAAHHILGIPHYAYDEQYPQTPVLTYRVDAGAHEVRMTGYPGVPAPGERCSLHVYIRRASTGAAFDDKVTLTVTEDRLIGTDPIVYGPVTAGLEEAVYKFFPTFDSEANYSARIEFEADSEPWIIDLPIVVGEPGSPWIVLGSVAAATVIFLVFVRAMRIKRRRREKSTQSRPGPARFPPPNGVIDLQTGNSGNQ